MAKFDDYTQKNTPEDNDITLILDKTANVNKKTPFSGIWNWIVNKMTNAVIQNLQTTNKTMIGAINELNSNKIVKISNAGYIDVIAIDGQYWSAIISTNTTGLHFAYANSYKIIEVRDIYKLGPTSLEIEAKEDSKTITIKLPNSSNQGFIILVGNPANIVTRK